MSKPYIVRGKAVPDWKTYDFASEYRNRTSQRGYMTGRTSPYKSEFELDGTLSRRSTFYSPPRLSPRSSRAFLAAKAAALGLPRSGLVNDWSRDPGSPSLSRARPLSPDHQSNDVDNTHANGGATPRAGSGSDPGAAVHVQEVEPRHRDLKRKMVFDLHKEISKSIHTIRLEEISDMDRITDICFNNLRVMMENKKHRKYLHHMNNNALVDHKIVLGVVPSGSLDFTNNAAHSTFKSEMQSSSNAKRLVQDATLARKASIRPLELIQVVSPIDPLKVRGPKSRTSGFLNQSKKKIIGRKLDLNEAEDILEEAPQHPQPQSKRTKKPAIAQSESSTTAALMNEIQEQLDSTKKNETPGRPPPTKYNSTLLTSEEALACHYLRINHDNVKRLEEAIREKGKDPGIHVHMNVDTYDVFSEIRRIRAQEREKEIAQAAYAEEEEYDKKGSRRRSSASSKGQYYPKRESTATSVGKGKAIIPGPARKPSMR